MSSRFVSSKKKFDGPMRSVFAISCFIRAYTDKDADYGIARIAEGLKRSAGRQKKRMLILRLETMAGKGTEIGRSFEEIAEIIDKVRDNDRLTVCMDTCHMHDAGYDFVVN